MAYKAVLVQVDPEVWEIFQAMCGNYKVSKNIRELVKREVDEFMREEAETQPVTTEA